MYEYPTGKSLALNVDYKPNNRTRDILKCTTQYKEHWSDVDAYGSVELVANSNLTCSPDVLKGAIFEADTVHTQSPTVLLDNWDCALSVGQEREAELKKCVEAFTKKIQQEPEKRCQCVFLSLEWKRWKSAL